jgi:hypothetical protein
LYSFILFTIKKENYLKNHLLIKKESLYGIKKCNKLLDLIIADCISLKIRVNKELLYGISISEVLHSLHEIKE